MKKRLIPVCLCVAFLVMEGFALKAVAYNGWVHTDLVLMALDRLIGEEYPDAEILQYSENVAYGTWYEDEVDIVYDIGNNPDLPPYSPTVTHFWDADSGPLDQVTLGVYGPYPNAFVKSCVLWSMAVAAYPADKDIAYQLLGHISHLLADMSVNAHVHEDMHPSGDLYEDYVNTQWHWLMNTIDQALLDEGLLDSIPPVTDLVATQVLPEYRKLYYLMYTTNQRADFFGSDDYDGDPNDFYFWSSGDLFGWMGDYNNELIANGWTYYHGAGTLDAIHSMVIAQSYTIPYTLRATATLFKLFGIAVNDPAFVCQGNFDGDLDVDGADLAAFAVQLGMTDCNSCTGDFDHDSDVDQDDLLVFADNYGKVNCSLQ